MKPKRKYTLDVEDKEILTTFKDSRYYAPIEKLLRSIEIRAENDVLSCPMDTPEKIVETRWMLDGCRRTLRSFQTELNTLSKINER